MLVMSVGIGFVALLTAFVADRFIRQEAGEKADEREELMLAELREIKDRLTALERGPDRGG